MESKALFFLFSDVDRVVVQIRDLFHGLTEAAFFPLLTDPLILPLISLFF